MLRRLRMICALACILSMLALPAAAGGYESEGRAGDDPAPAIVDALILRPAGLVALGLGALVFVFPVTPIMLLTRPSEIHKPFKTLVVKPAKYVYADPLGTH